MGKNAVCPNGTGGDRDGNPVPLVSLVPIADTSAARATLATIGAGAVVALAERSTGSRSTRAREPIDVGAVHEAEARAADLFNAAAAAAAAFLSAGTASAATLDMLRTAARLTGALAGLTLVDTNNCKGQS